MSGTYHHTQLLVEMGSLKSLPALALNSNPPDFNLQVARIIGTSHWHPAFLGHFKHHFTNFQCDSINDAWKISDAFFKNISFP
jgi:hypothetical protein